MTESKIFDLYESLNLSKNSICRECINSCLNRGEKLSFPTSIWQVGSDYVKSKNRLLFVGKVAINGNNLGKVVNKKFVDATKHADMLFEKNHSAYWGYTKSILERIFKENAWEKIAFSNLIKCDNSTIRNTASNAQKHNCINRLGVIWKEIKTLNPKKIIFYTGLEFDDYIERFNLGMTCVDLTKKDYTIKIGEKYMPWWERSLLSNSGNIQMLRVGSPRKVKKRGICRSNC